MKQYLPHAALAVLLGALCVPAPAKTFKCLSNSTLDCPPETTDFGSPTLSGTTDLPKTTFKSKSKDDKHDKDKDGGPGSWSTGGGGSYTPSRPGIATAVPEPEGYAMMALGLGILAWSLRRRRPV